MHYLFQIVILLSAGQSDSPPEFYGVVYEDGSIYEGACTLNGHFTDEKRTRYRGTGYYLDIIEYEKVSELIFLIDDEKVRVPVKN